MTDAQVRQQVERADRFIERLRDMIAATPVDPASKCADEQRRGLRRIAATLDAVPFVMFCNLANIDAAMRGGLMEMIEVRLIVSVLVQSWILPTRWRSLRRSCPDRDSAQAAAAMTG